MNEALSSENIANLQQVRTGSVDKPDFSFGEFELMIPLPFLFHPERGTPTTDILQQNIELAEVSNGLVRYDGTAFWLRVKVMNKFLLMFYNQVIEFEQLIPSLRGHDHQPIIAVTNCLVQSHRTPFSPFYGTQDKSGNPCGIFIIGVLSKLNGTVKVQKFDLNNEIQAYIAECKAKESLLGGLVRQNTLTRGRDEDDDNRRQTNQRIN